MLVRFLIWEDTLEESMAAPSSILAWRIPWTEEPGELQSMGLQRVRCLQVHIKSIYMSIPISQFIHPTLPSLVSMFVPCVCLYFCFASKIICTIFLDSTCMC